MDIVEFINFAKRHRLSLKKFSFPTSNKDWNELFFEALWRDNSVLLDALYSKCPEEYKNDVSSFILDIVVNNKPTSIKQFSQKLLKWVFNNIDFEPNKYLSAFTISDDEREDLLEYVLNNNKNHDFDLLIYNTAESLSFSGGIRLFKKIASNIDLNILHKKYNNGETVSFRNPFVRLFLKSENKETLEYVLQNLKENKEPYYDLIQNFSRITSNIEENINYAEMLDMVFSSMQKRFPNLWNEFKTEITDKDSQLPYKLMLNLSIYHAKILDNHNILTPFIFYRVIEELSASRNSDTAFESLKYLYDNFDDKKINESFSDVQKSEFFANLIIRDQFDVADFLFQKNPHIPNDYSKKYLNNTLLTWVGSGNNRKNGIEWAKKYLTLDEIDDLIADPINKKFFEELTTWKCEHFLNKKQENKVEKPKLKI